MWRFFVICVVFVILHLGPLSNLFTGSCFVCSLDQEPPLRRSTLMVNCRICRMTQRNYWFCNFHCSLVWLGDVNEQSSASPWIIYSLSQIPNCKICRIISFKIFLWRCWSWSRQWVPAGSCKTTQGWIESNKLAKRVHFAKVHFAKILRNTVNVIQI